MGGVLVGLDRHKCIDAFSAIGFPDFGDYLDPYKQKDFFAAFENGDLTAAQFRDEVRRHISRPETADQEIDDALNIFLTGINPAKIRFLRDLRNKYKLFLLSNTNPISWKHTQELFEEAGGVPMVPAFDRVFLSFEMNKSKPGEAIFRQVLRDAGIRAEESLFVDDGPANTAAASGMGFRVLLYDVNTDLAAKVTEALEKW